MSAVRSAAVAALLVTHGAGPVRAQPGGAGQTEARSSSSVPGRVVDGVTFVAAGPLATVLGDVVTAAGGVLTWRGSEGVATFFIGSSDALLQRPQNGGPDDWALSTRVQLVTGGSQDLVGDWLLPLDAVQLVGVATRWVGDLVTLHTPSGALLTIDITTGDAQGDAASTGQSQAASQGATEVGDIAGVTTLRFFDDDLAVLLLDLDLAPLAYPELTDVIDAAAATAGEDQALLALVTSLSTRQWSSSLTFEQDGSSVEVRSYYRFHLFVGDPEVVAPDAPAAGVILLPPVFSLYRPITVSWSGLTATVTFRR